MQIKPAVPRREKHKNQLQRKYNTIYAICQLTNAIYCVFACRRILGTTFVFMGEKEKATVLLSLYLDN